MKLPIGYQSDYSPDHKNGKTANPVFELGVRPLSIENIAQKESSRQPIPFKI